LLAERSPALVLQTALAPVRQIIRRRLADRVEAQQVLNGKPSGGSAYLRVESGIAYAKAA
jgi:hypothetical protein